MLQVRRGLDLGQEPLGAEHRGQLRAQDLERDLAVVPEVLGEVDGRHAAGAELALDAVAVLRQVKVATSLCIVDPTTTAMQIVNAGHMSPVIRRPDGDLHRTRRPRPVRPAGRRLWRTIPTK